MLLDVPEPFSVLLVEEEDWSRVDEGEEAGMLLRRGRLEVEEEARSPRAVV